MKTKKIVISLIVIAISGIFLLKTKPVQTFLWKNVSTTQDMLEDCFAYPAIKCGISSFSDDHILEEIRYLELTKEEAIDVILKAKKEDEEELEELSRKENLSEHEIFVKNKLESTRGYHDRVLRIIERME